MKRFECPPFNLCAQCGAEIVAPIKAEHLDERHVRNLWSCEACGYQFETSVYFPLSKEARRQVQPQEADRRVQLVISTKKEGHMRYKPKSAAALQIALGGLPDKMRVEVAVSE